MKKYLMIGAAACLLGGAMLTSCSSDKDLYDGAKEAERNAENLLKDYAANFQKVFGEISPDQTWGFGAPAGARATRAITVNGDVYDKFPSAEEVDANFPTAIPNDAKTDEEIVAEWKGKNAVDENGNEIIAYGNPVTMWDAYAIYLNMVGKVIKNIKVTAPGEYTVGHSWANPADRVYNVYIAVGDGNSLTLKRNGAEHVNFYIMSGNITIDSNFGECGGIISVAEGATVNDQRTHIAHNDGVKVFNRGTYNATNTTPYWNGSENISVFDIGNFCTFYNEGKFACSSGISYSPGDANDSYFMNLGDDAEVTAASMTLNSTGNFFNSGKVTITGETLVTQARLYWVNGGHYTTGSMTFSAKNTTFYNYCQLIVQGNAHMFDGEFNLMENSYTEAGTAELDNFIVNMGSNTGMYIKGNVRMIAQADGTYQGFRTSGNNDYLLIDGKVTVDAHKNTFSISNGITHSINAIEIVREGNVITEEYLQSIGDGDYPVLDLNGTECPYGKLSVTPNTNSCGATWKTEIPTPPTKPFLRVIAEDLTTKEKGDFDFNDIVFDVEYVSATQAKVTILAAGGTLPLTINGQEVHQLFIDANPNASTDQGGEINVMTMINTNAQRIARAPYSSAELENKPVLNLSGNWSDDQDTFSAQVRDNIPLVVTKTNEDGTTYTLTLTAEKGKTPGKVGIASPYYEWKQEKVYIGDGFKKFVSDPTYAMWWKE